MPERMRTGAFVCGLAAAGLFGCAPSEPGSGGRYTTPERTIVLFQDSGDPFEVVAKSGFGAEEYWCAAGQFARRMPVAHNAPISRISAAPDTPPGAWRFTFANVGDLALPSELSTLGESETSVSASKARNLCVITRNRFPTAFFN